MSSEKFISIEGIAKRYPGADGGAIAVFEDLWLSMARGEFGCVIGHSGCGKTTVLTFWRASTSRATVPSSSTGWRSKAPASTAR
jgi:ABC-type nitrate/sulfonate/bicarbonate transport system ATPase subunit